MGMELFKSMAGIDLQHVPFRGTGPAVTEMLSGRVPTGLSNTLTAIPHIEAGTLRALAVTGSKRAQALPNVPAIAEAGVPGYEALQWYGLLAPAGTPATIVNRLQRTSRAPSTCRTSRRSSPPMAPRRSAARRRSSPR